MSIFVLNPFKGRVIEATKLNEEFGVVTYESVQPNKKGIHYKSTVKADLVFLTHKDAENAKWLGILRLQSIRATEAISVMNALPEGFFVPDGKQAFYGKTAERIRDAHRLLTELIGKLPVAADATSTETNAAEQKTEN